MHSGLRRTGRLAAFPLAASLLLLGAAGCDRSTDDRATDDRSASSSPSAIRAADVAGVTAEIRQGRADWADRVVQVRVDNAGAAPLTATSVELTAPGVDGVATSDAAASREIPARWYRDLSVQLGAPRCDADEAAAPAGTATVHLVDAAGRTADAVVAVSDPRGHLARIHGEDCAALAVAESASVRLRGDLQVEDRGGSLVGVLGLVVDPVPGTPVLTISHIEGTVLLSPADGVAWTLPELAAPLTAPTTARLEFTPSRCDPHAVAEDKRGTFLGLHAALDGAPEPTFYLGVPPEVLGEVHAYVALYCGW